MTLFKLTGANAYAGCCYCCVKGEYCSALDKMVYLQNRAFLPCVDKLHSDCKNFPCKKVLKPQPTPKTMNYVDAANGRLSAAILQSKKKKIHQETGCKGSYALGRLPHHDCYLNTLVEPMHLFKNLAEHIVKLLYGFSDTEKVRNEEQNRSHLKKCGLCRRPLLKEKQRTLSHKHLSVFQSLIFPLGTTEN